MLTEGELRSAESTPITPPGNSAEPRTISWMAPNFGTVKKGDIIARFDVSRSELSATASGLELNKVDIQVLGKQRELERLLSELGNDLELVDIEKVMADRFVVEDSLAYSRFEIIDATRDKELLEYRSGHLEGKKGTYSDRQGAEIQVLEALRATQESENQQHQALIENSVVFAPHDGFLVYEKRWHGQLVEVGSTVFPGNKIASIPNLEKMEAELKVLETDAVGIRPGQSVDLRIDAFPERPLSGTVSSISATAAPINRDNPAKYFTVIVAVDQADPEWITPQAQVTAEIHISQVADTISVPNQSLFKDEKGDWVLRVDGNKLVRQPVQLGLRGANRSEVTSGLENGDEIALYPPSEQSS